MAVILAIIVLGLTFVVGSLVMFAWGTRENQSTPPSTAAENVFSIGLLLAGFIIAFHWWPF